MDTPILVVEDNAVNRLAIGVLLRSLGFTCDQVASGLEALSAVRSKPYAMILMDLVMATMDGFETAHAIRSLEFATGRRTPILAVTALDADEAQRRCVEAGIDDIVRKPVDAATIAAQLHKWAGLTPPRWDTAAAETPSEEVVRLLHSEQMSEVIDAFLSVTSRLLGELEAAISAHDDLRIRHAVHELKGASLQVRATEMARLCFDLEVASRKDNRTEMVAIYAALAHAFVRIKRVTERKGTISARPTP